jgi:hypothetical protein
MSQKTNATPDPHGRFPILLSYAFVRKSKPALIEALFTNPDVEILLDCGAFSALNAGEEIKLSDYIGFLDDWKDKLFGYLALDVLGNPDATSANLATMLDHGLHPIPVHVRGDGEARMDELFQYSDWVALGGLRRPQRGWCKRSYVKQKMDWAKGRNVHWLGYTKQQMIAAFKPYSVDSASWASGQMYGFCHVYLGDGRWLRPIRQWHRHSIPPSAMAHIQTYGFTRAQVENAANWRAGGECFLPLHITMRSTSGLYATSGRRSARACSWRRRRGS